MSLAFQPVKVATEAGDGFLVFSNGLLIAVLVRLSELHVELRGRWFLEFTLTQVNGPEYPIFETLDQAQAWIAKHLTVSQWYRTHRPD